MNQEDINSVMWDSLPEWRKHQLRMEYDQMCTDSQHYAEKEHLRSRVEQYGRDMAKNRKRIRELEEKVAKLREALEWCSGSADFGKGGQARVGWVKLCEPLLREMR